MTVSDGWRRRAARWLLVVVYLPFGLFHILRWRALMPIMPPWVPFPHEVIVLTGVAEVLGAVGLCIPTMRKAAGVGLALYAVGVFPANLHHALDGVSVPGLPSSWWYHGPRLALQPVFVWWALWAGEVIDWPFGRRNSVHQPHDNLPARDAGERYGATERPGSGGS